MCKNTRISKHEMVKNKTTRKTNPNEIYICSMSKIVRINQSSKVQGVDKRVDKLNSKTARSTIPPQRIKSHSPFLQSIQLQWKTKHFKPTVGVKILCQTKANKNLNVHLCVCVCSVSVSVCVVDCKRLYLNSLVQNTHTPPPFSERLVKWSRTTLPYSASSSGDGFCVWIFPLLGINAIFPLPLIWCLT